MDYTQAEQLVAQYGQTIYRLAYARTGSREDAEDITQETFLRLVRANPQFRDEEHRKAWLLRTTINLCRRVTQSSWRKKTVPLTDDGDTPIPFREPEENQVWQALTQLEETYRLPIYLFYFQELSTREIARVLSIRPGAVRMRLSRGREQLRILLKGDYFDE